MRKSVLAVLIALFTISFAALPAHAITYGTPDGNLHPEVGALVGTFNGQTHPYCSGTLISPNVFLTAAHCDIGASRVFVTFDSQYTSNSVLYEGTFYADPQFNFKQNNPHDIAVVVFDDPIPGITPALLPEAGSLRNLPKDQQFTTVGYGAQEVVNQPGGPVISYLFEREYAVPTLNATNPNWLRMSQNPATGDSGSCYGDSGGPNFLGAGATETNIIASITITGDALCKATNVTYRLDTPSAREFLSAFVTLP